MTFSARVIIRGIVLGLGAAVPIGPVNVEIARRTLRHGFIAGFALGCGAVTVDVTYAILSSLSLGRLMDHSAVRWPITVGGIALLLYLGAMCLRSAARDLKTDPIRRHAPAASGGAAYFTGVLLTLLNPMTLGFWFLVVPAALRGITQEPRRDLPMICAGVFIGTIAWVISFAGTLAFAGRWRKNWWLASADAAGGLVLFAFAAIDLWHAMRPVL